ncbi:MAG: HNH endonuclease [Peptostreptococcaceae bacterium]
MAVQINSGDKFYRLTIVSQDETRNEIEKQRKLRGEINKSEKYFICRCDCGNEKSIMKRNLISGHTKSCGCLHKDVVGRVNRIDVERDVCIVYNTSEDRCFTIDSSIKSHIEKYCWYIGKDGYWRAKAENRYIILHQFIAKTIFGDYDKSKFVPDHLDRNKSNNTSANLQLKTRHENSKNRSINVNNTSGATGVSWDKNKNEWTAYIKVNYKLIYLGSFKSFKEACSVRKDAETKYGFTKYLVSDNGNTETVRTGGFNSTGK